MRPAARWFAESWFQRRAPTSRLLTAARRGNAAAQFQLASILLDQAGAARQAETWLRRAAALGHAPAQYRLSLLYLSGARPRGAAAIWYAAANDTPAERNRALLYPDGFDVAPAFEKSFALAEAAAAQGLALAQSHLGMLYLREIGCRRDDAAALRWFRLAADQADAGGALGLAIIHEHGLGLPRDMAAAARWYAQAVARGNEAAATALGLLYLKGQGVSRDLAKAQRLLQRPASLGDHRARDGLAEIERQRDAAQSETLAPDPRLATS